MAILDTTYRTPHSQSPMSGSMQFGTIGKTSFLSNQEISSFFEHGYLIKKKIFQPFQIQEMKKSCDDLYDILMQEAHKDIYPSDGSQIEIELEGTQFVFKKHIQDEEQFSLSLLRAVGCGSCEPSLLNYLRSIEMVHTFSSLLKSNTIEHLICQFHPKRPGDGTRFQPHRDIYNRKFFDPQWKDINGEGSYVVGIIAIDPMSYANGGLYIIEDSHKTMMATLMTYPL